MSEFDDGSVVNASAESLPATKSIRFEFRGDGWEYFRIWITNILLTLITLGIYSAWATVRNKRYFYSNTYIGNDNFRYLASPITILKGRLIALFAVIVYFIVSATSFGMTIVFTVILMLLIPFFVNKSFSFKNRMSSFKNIQFRFKGSYGEAFMVIYIWPLLGVLSFGILYPLALLKANEYFVRNSSYGTSHFDFNARYTDYAIICLIVVGIGLTAGGIITLVSYVIPYPTGAATFITVLPVILAYFAAIVYYKVSLTNLYYASSSLVGHKFEANLEFVALSKVILINILLTIITLGLYLPAAKVRMAKYMCSALTLDANGSLDDFSAAEKENVGALGEEMGQAFDFS